jgi:hypothetical protein
MSKATEAGVHFEEAAIAFRCNPDTMRKGYPALDDVALTHRVMDAISGQRQWQQACRRTKVGGGPKVATLGFRMGRKTEPPEATRSDENVGRFEEETAPEIKKPVASPCCDG